jgi:hypothetical protein
MGMGLASDTSGNLYTYASRGSVPTEYGVLKFSSANPLSFAFASEGSLGITNLDIRDMTVKDGKLYILAGRDVWTGYTTHHGKLVEVDPTSLTKTRELGVSPGIYPSNPEVQFYGPQRFIALKPRKLVIADEGLVAVNAQIDRIVEVDLESWSFSQTRDVTADISFFHAYSFC